MKLSVIEVNNLHRTVTNISTPDALYTAVKALRTLRTWRADVEQHDTHECAGVLWSNERDWQQRMGHVLEQIATLHGLDYQELMDRAYDELGY